MSVRQLTAADVPVLRALRLESLRLHPECFGADLDAEEAMSIEEMTSRMATATSFGGFVDGELAGMVVFSKTSRKKIGHTGDLGAMYVRKSARGSGLSDALVGAVISYAVGRVDQIKLTVNAENPPAIKLYERHGFRTIGKFPDSIRVDGRSYEELIMLCPVPGGGGEMQKPKNK